MQYRTCPQKPLTCSQDEKPQFAYYCVWWEKRFPFAPPPSLSLIYSARAIHLVSRYRWAAVCPHSSYPVTDIIPMRRTAVTQTAFYPVTFLARVYNSPCMCTMIILIYCNPQYVSFFYSIPPGGRVTFFLIPNICTQGNSSLARVATLVVLHFCANRFCGFIVFALPFGFSLTYKRGSMSGKKSAQKILQLNIIYKCSIKADQL